MLPAFFVCRAGIPGRSAESLLVQNNATGCMMLLNRRWRIWSAHGGDPSRMFMHDWFIALTAAAFGRVVFVDQPLTRYRQHDGNAIGASRPPCFAEGLSALGNRKGQGPESL